jgi:D-alanine-D-alanine ligase-like ATP-grasp enzyme
VDILVDKDYIWHLSGVPVNPSDLVHRVDMVWNTAHPSFSNILLSLSIPTIGPSSFSHGLESSKEILKKHIKAMGLEMPRQIVLPVYQKDFDGPKNKYAIKKGKVVFEKFSAPWIVKSLTPDLSMGMHLAKTFPELVGAIEDGVNHGQSIVIEEFIMGKVASLHSVPDFRGQGIYTFPLGNSFGNFSLNEKDKLANIAKDLHKHIDAGHYLKSDFVMNSRGKVYLLGIDSHPDLKVGSHFHEVVSSVGAKMNQVLEHILDRP